MVFNNNFVVTIKCDGKILREKNGTVYLPFGVEYSILMKNLSSRKALVEIEIDGKDVLNKSKLIIPPNSTIELERYLKNLQKGNKFKFIEKTQDISEYRGDRVDDGIVRVSYRFEKEKPIEVTERVTEPYPYPVPYPKPFQPYQPYWTTCSNNEATTSRRISVNNSSSCSNEVSVGSMSFSEDGITVPGSISNQEFECGDIGELEDHSHVITLLLRGQIREQEVIKPLTVKSKLFCDTCGKRNEGNINFCGKCGTALKFIE